MRQTKAFTIRYVRELFRSKAALFWTMIFPAGFYLITITMTIPDEAMGAGEGGVKAVIAVSFGMFGAIIAALNSFCEQLGTDLEADRYHQFRSLSIAPSSDLTGRLLAGVTLSVTAFLAVLPVAVLTGAEFSLASPLSPAVVVLAIVTFAIFWMVVAIAVTVSVRNERYASIITVSLALVAYMMTGYNGTDVSVYHGPDWLLNGMPHTLATRLIADQTIAGSAGLTPPTVPTVLSGLGLLIVYSVGALAIGIVLTRRVLYKREVVA